MARQDLVGALKNALERGESIEEAKKTLINAGYSFHDVEEAAKEIENIKGNTRIPKVPIPSFLPRLSPQIIKKIPPPPQRRPPQKYPTFSTSKKKRLNILILIFTGIIITAIIFYFFIFGQHTIKQIDCGSDIECFIEASKNCRNAKLLSTFEFDFLSIVFKGTIFWKIEKEDSKCSLFWRNEKINARLNDTLVRQMLSQGISREEIRKMEEELNKNVSRMEGFTAICKFNNYPDLTHFLTQWLKEKNFESTFSLGGSLGEENEIIFPNELLEVAECKKV